jgi:heme-based aerotactic transducer
MSLVEKFHLDSAGRARRKAFVRISDDETRLLRSMLPVMQKHVHRIVEDFYTYLFSYEETQAFFADAGAVERAKSAQREYLLDLFRGNFDEAYFERRLQIGVVHESIGLDAKWYLGSNSVFLELIVPVLAAACRFRPRRLSRAILALSKVMNLDQQLVMDTYIESTIGKIRALSDQVLRTIEILAPSARDTAQLSEAAAKAVAGALKVAEQGSSTVAGALEGMSELKGRAGTAAEETRRLSEQIGKIESIVSVLDGFTTDTNLLALNASVQAARAGQQSKGFGVIAEEIRRLADQSKESLSQAHALVAEIKQGTGAALAASEAGTRNVEEGTELTRQIGDAFGSLAASAQTVSTNVQQMTTNVREQSEAILQLRALVDGDPDHRGDVA